MSNKIIVIKCGGSILTNQNEFIHIANDLSTLLEKNYKPVVIHGGGPEITQLCNKLNINSEFKDGLRVTTNEVLDITQMALLGITNPKLVQKLNQNSINSAGLALHTTGSMLAELLDFNAYGYVGKITSINAEPIYQLIKQGVIPVITPLAVDKNWQLLNINADLAAAAIACAIAADKLILLSDIDGYYSDYPDPNSLIKELDSNKLRYLLENNNGSIASGMIPKLEACLLAINGKVKNAHIINGKQTNALSDITLGLQNIGTTIYAPQDTIIINQTHNQLEI